MEKILLVTIQDDRNYGNRLQNYALQTVLEKLGYRVDNLFVREDKRNEKQSMAKKLVKSAVVLFKVRKYSTNGLEYEREKRIRKFTERCIHNPVWCSESDLSMLGDQYDHFVTGSDQVWHNWNKFPSELDTFYLKFAPAEKRIAYAPSFGFTEFPAEDIERHRSGILQMKSLSCREMQGVDLIRELTGREAEKVLDPTMLLEAEDWQKIERKPAFKVPEKYLLKFFLGKVSQEYQEETDRIAKEMQIPVLNINSFDHLKQSTVSPDEFIWLVSHADAVCTDSFHASVFSILFRRNLRVFPRISAYGNMFGRLHDLLEPIGLLDLAFGSGSHTLSTELGENGMTYLMNERTKSVSYLKNSLTKAADPCIADKIIVSEPGSEKHAYACINKNKENRMKESSGGVYSLIAEEILKQGGTVFAAVYDDDLNVVHRKIQNLDELQASFGAKYAASEAGTCFREIKDLVNGGMKVLFVGTPCQCAALSKYAGKHDNLYIIDFVCHGVPGRKYWQLYLKSLRENSGINASSVNMRDKTSGWSYYQYAFSVTDSEGKKRYQTRKNNLYMAGFLSDVYLQPGCYTCPFKENSRVSDITLGDCWGIWNIRPSMDDNKGTSLVIVRSGKGKELFDSVSDRMKTVPLKEQEYSPFNKSIYRSARKPAYYDDFHKRLKAGEDIQKLLSEYLNIPVSKTSWKSRAAFSSDIAIAEAKRIAHKIIK